MTLILALEGWRRKGDQEFRGILKYIVSRRPTWATKPLLQNMRKLDSESKWQLESFCFAAVIAMHTLVFMFINIKKQWRLHLLCFYLLLL